MDWLHLPTRQRIVLPRRDGSIPGSPIPLPQQTSLHPLDRPPHKRAGSRTKRFGDASMSDNTREMLTKNMQGIREDIESFARQIESGEYEGEFVVWDYETDEALATGTFASEERALEHWREIGDNRETYA